MSYSFGIVHDDDGLRVDLAQLEALTDEQRAAFLGNIPKGRWQVNGHVHTPGTAGDTLSVYFTRDDQRHGGSASMSAPVPAPPPTTNA